FPSAPTYNWQQKFSVSMDGSTVSSTSTLASGTKYLVQVSSTEPLVDGYSSDAGYWYSDSNDRAKDNVLDDSPFGLSVTGVTRSSSSDVNNWGAFNTSVHTYYQLVTGQGTTATFAFNDADYDNSDQTSSDHLVVTIYAVNASGATPSGTS